MGLRNGGRVLLVLVHSPVEDVVVLEALADKEIAEDLAQVGVVRLIVEAEATGVVEVDGELVREAAAQDFRGRGHLLLHDAVVLLLLGRRLKALPGQATTAEVQHHVAQRFHVITTRLLYKGVSRGSTHQRGCSVHTDTQMRVDGRVTSGTRQVLVLTVRDVEVRLRIPVLLRQTEVDDVDLVAPLANPHQEVVRLDITVDEALGVDVLDAGDELVGEEQHGLEGELAVAEVEEVFERRAEQVEHHGVVVTLRAEPSYEGNADAAGKGFVDAGFVLQLRVLGFNALELDGDLLSGDDVSACDARQSWRSWGLSAVDIPR